jgi:hypothetical protein
MTTPTDATGDETRDRARESIDHLQAAARELIAAARAALDVAERLIDDPETVSAVVGVAGKLGDLLRVGSSRPSRGTSATDDDRETVSSDESGFDRGGPTVERITIR